MSIITKLINARKSEHITGLQKKDSKKLGYSYYSAPDVITAAKKAFDAEGLAILPIKADLVKDEQIQCKNSTLREATVTVDYYLVDTNSKEKLKISALGRAQDVLEKNISKAQTQALKTALMTVLMIAEDSDCPAMGEISPELIEKYINEAQSEEDYKKILDLINSLANNSDKTRLNRLLKQKKGV